MTFSFAALSWALHSCKCVWGSVCKLGGKGSDIRSLQRSQKNENNQQTCESTEQGWKGDKESEREQRREGGGAGGWVGGELWQTEKWSTGLAFIWAAYWDWQEWMMTPSSSIANHNLHLNLHFSQVHCSNCLWSSFYHLVERVHDAWAACFDLFHLIGAALPRINQRAGIYQVNLNSWHQKMIYILHTYQRYNFSLLIIGKYIGSLKCFEIRANYSKPTDPID